MVALAIVGAWCLGVVAYKVIWTPLFTRWPLGSLVGLWAVWAVSVFTFSYMT